MIDETTDASGVEEVAADELLTPEEIFLRWHVTAKQDSLAHLKLLEDSLLRFGMNLSENSMGEARMDQSSWWTDCLV